MLEKTQSWRWVLVAILAVGLGAAGYLFFVHRLSEESGAATVKLALGVEKSLLTTAIWVAEDQKYFQDEGLGVTIHEFGSGRLSFLAMLDGKVDVSTVAPTPVMLSSFDRDDFSIFATIVYSDNDVKVIANADRGIRTVKDLVGKRIGTPKGTTGQFFLNAFLVHNGLPASEISEVSLKPSQLPNALKSGEVDAIVIWEPTALNAKRLLKEKAVQLPSSEIYRETFNLIVMKTFQKDHPQVLERLLRAIDRATTFVWDQKTESQEIVSRRLRLDREELVALWDDFMFEISLDKSLMVTLEDEARWAIENDLTKRREVPNYLNFIYSDALKKVKPQVVTLIH